MEKTVFFNMIEELEKRDNKTKTLYHLGVDLTELDSPFESVIRDLMIECFGVDGEDMISWWCYEKDFGKREDLTCQDKDGNLICQDLDGLYEYIQNSKT
jgi:hypothetical protein